MFQCLGKVPNAAKELFGVFSERSHHHPLHLRRNGGLHIAQGRSGREDVLGGNPNKRAAKVETTAEPFVDDNTQRILITRRTRLALNLFGGHVGDGADHVLGVLVA